MRISLLNNGYQKSSTGSQNLRRGTFGKDSIGKLFKEKFIVLHYLIINFKNFDFLVFHFLQLLLFFYINFSFDFILYFTFFLFSILVFLLSFSISFFYCFFFLPSFSSLVFLSFLSPLSSQLLTNLSLTTVSLHSSSLITRCIPPVRFHGLRTYTLPSQQETPPYFWT